MFFQYICSVCIDIYVFFNSVLNFANITKIVECRIYIHIILYYIYYINYIYK